jgi:hypothetical protein
MPFSVSFSCAPCHCLSPYQRSYHIKYLSTNCMNFTASIEFNARAFYSPLSSSEAWREVGESLELFVFYFCKSLSELSESIISVRQHPVHVSAHCLCTRLTTATSHHSTLIFNALLILGKRCRNLSSVRQCVLTCI